MCKVCGKPLASKEAGICGECLRDEVPFKRMWVFGIYEGALREAINLLKYHRIRRLSRPLAEFFFEMHMPDVDIVMPVPLHVKRLRDRGFNQSALLARYIAKKMNLSLDLNTLVRVRFTEPQVGLSARDRTENIKGAFRVVKGDTISNSDVLLVDDVITTGSTMKECAQQLIRAGAKGVYCVALARGIME